MTRDDPHDIPQDLLVAYSLGLLDEASAARFEVHLADCGDCRLTLARLRGEEAPPAAGSGHLPASIVAHWEDSVARLRGIERAMVREHLAECGECRALLESLGLEAGLPELPELEVADPAWLGARFPQAATSSAKPDVRDTAPPAVLAGEIRPLRSPRQLATLIFGAGGWVAAAAVIALTFFYPPTNDQLVVPGPIAPLPSAVQPDPSLTTAPSSPTSAEGAARVAPLTFSSPAELVPVRRGAEAQVSGDSMRDEPVADAARVNARTGWITVALPEGLWDEPLDRIVDIAIKDPQHRTRYAATVRLGDIDARQELHWPVSTDSLQTGTYNLVCRVRGVAGSSESHTYEGTFRVLVQRR